MFLHWSDVNFELRTVRVTAKRNWDSTEAMGRS